MSDLDGNLQLWLPLNEEEGSTAYDYSGFDRHGTWAGTPTFSSDAPFYAGSAMFDGTNYIDAPAVGAMDNYTLSWWQHPDVGTGGGTQWKAGGFRSPISLNRYAADGDWFINFYDWWAGGYFGRCSQSDQWMGGDHRNWPAGAWTHFAVAISKANSLFSIWTNGALRGTAALTFLTAPNVGFRIGNVSSGLGANRPFQGLMSDLRIHSLEINDADALTLYSWRPPTGPNLAQIHYYNMVTRN